MEMEKQQQQQQRFDWIVALPVAAGSNSITQMMLPLPPKSDEAKPTLVLGLDGTLVTTSRWNDARQGRGFMGILKRPGLDDFLKALCDKYELVVFGHSDQDVADVILDKIDPSRLNFQHRLYNRHCKARELLCCDPEGEYRVHTWSKDVSKLGRNLGRLVIVNENPLSYIKHLENGLDITKFCLTSTEDAELGRLTEVLLELAAAEDIVAEIRAREADLRPSLSRESRAAPENASVRRPGKRKRK